MARASSAHTGESTTDEQRNWYLQTGFCYNEIALSKGKRACSQSNGAVLFRFCTLVILVRWRDRGSMEVRARDTAGGKRRIAMDCLGSFSDV